MVAYLEEHAILCRLARVVLPEFDDGSARVQCLVEAEIRTALQRKATVTIPHLKQFSEITMIDC